MIPSCPPTGECACGCGEATPLAAKTITRTGIQKGKPLRFIHGHNRRREGWQTKTRDDASNPSGICQCGCGEPTARAPRTERSKGWVKGEPLRYALGHNAKITNHPRRHLSSEDYTVEDRGFETPCWIWRGVPVNQQGYCRVGIDGGHEEAHRAYYERFVGPIPAGFHLHHRCEQPSCVRPNHLEPLTLTAHRRAHSRLTWEDIEWIRTGVHYREVVTRLGISVTHVYDIRNGKVWT